MRLEVKSSNKVGKAVNAVHEQAWLLVDKAAKTMQGEARTLVETSVGSGRKYSSLPQRSSAPYEIPVAQVPGRLAGKIQVYPAPLGKRVPAAECGSDDPTVRALDQGTSRIAPRPFMTQASYAGGKALAGDAPRIGRALKKPL